MSAAAGRHLAQRAMHARMRLAFDAARAAGVPGRFHAVETDGFLLVLTTADGLSFLNTVTVTAEASWPGLPDVLALFRDSGAPGPVVVTGGDVDPRHLTGLEPVGPRPLAVLDPGTVPADPAYDTAVRVDEVRTPADRARFLDVLAAGYDAPPAVERFVRVEHANEAVTGFVARVDDVVVGAAAMSVHVDGVVLGGAATVPAHRGAGAQTALLRTRLAAARTSGVGVVAATATPGSPSLRNLERAGCTVVLRQGWRAPVG